MAWWRANGAAVARRLLPRVLLLVVLVTVGDRVTVQMTHHDWVLSRGVVIVLRLLTALPVLRYPFVGFVMALEADKWDWYWLGEGARSAAAHADYQELDKVLDLFTLAMGLAASWCWSDRPMRRLLTGTLALRVVGVSAFLLTRQGWLLIAAPNVFENLFLMYAVFRLISGHERMLVDRASMVLVGVVALVPKLIEEYFLHLLDRRPWDWVNLPVPDAIEPRVWLAGMYLPMLMVVLALVTRTSRDGDHYSLSLRRVTEDDDVGDAQRSHRAAPADPEFEDTRP